MHYQITVDIFGGAGLPDNPVAVGTLTTTAPVAATDANNNSVVLSTRVSANVTP
jgi:hypothetical protein